MKRLAPVLRINTSASLYAPLTSQTTLLSQDAATVGKTVNSNSGAGDLAIKRVRVDAPRCCRSQCLTAAPVISCTSKRTHTHPLSKHHPPAQNEPLETPFPPFRASLCLELCQFLVSCVFLRSVFSPGAPLLPALALLFPSPYSLLLTLFPLCAPLSNELKNTLVKHR